MIHVRYNLQTLLKEHTCVLSLLLLMREVIREMKEGFEHDGGRLQLDETWLKAHVYVRTFKS